MTVSTDVKWAISSMVGAPTLNGTAGSMIAVLDAFLVNGFGMKAVDSAQVTGGVCRLNFTGASAALDHSVIVLAGATGTGAVLNGNQRVKAATASHVEFACSLPDGPVTGTITFKIAPLGWEKVFTATTVAVYRGQDVLGTRIYLRVDDSSATNTRVVGYEDMTSVNTGAGAFPTQAQVSGGGYWPKASAADAGSRAWTLVGDGRGFVLHVHTPLANKGISGSCWGFGDFTSLKSGDAYACALFCAATDVAAQSAAQTNAMEYSGASIAAVYLPRSFTGVGSALAARHGGESFVTANGVAGAVASAAVPQYPNGPGNSLVLSRKVLIEPSIALRGRLRGVHIPAQVCHGAFAWADTVDGAGDLVGRKLLAIKCGSPAGTESQGVMFLDITGPWS